MASRSKGNPLPASAPEPSGSTLARRAGFAEPLPIAREHFEVRQQVMRPQHGLRAPHVRVARNHRVGILRARSSRRRIIPAMSSARTWSHSSRSQRRVSSETCSLRLRPVWILSATAPARLLQFADDQRVDVFVGGAFVEIRRIALPRAICVERRRRSARAHPPSECRPVPAPARKPASRGYRHRSGAGRNQASRKSARRLPTVRIQIVHPRVSFDRLQ